MNPAQDERDDQARLTPIALTRALPAHDDAAESSQAAPSAAPARPSVADWQARAKENWRPLTAVALMGVGIIFVLLGWYGAAHTNILTEQIPYLISGGLLGLGLIVVAGFFASSAALERENRAMRAELARALAAVAQGAHANGNGAAPPEGDERVYAVPAGRSYHVAGCPILEGKDGVRALTPAKASSAGLVSCKLCGPD